MVRVQDREEVFTLDANDDSDQELDARATALKEEIERRLASGPATPMDFSEVKRRIHEEVEARRASAVNPTSTVARLNRAELGVRRS
jgi:hypothetical protein